jgi:hypothetical protein
MYEPKLDVDLMLPSQYEYRNRRPVSEFSGELKLCFAVLENAILEWHRISSPKFQEYYSTAHIAARRHWELVMNELLDWFTEKESVWPMAFEAICDRFSIDADAVRSSLGIRNNTVVGPHRLHAPIRRIHCGLRRGVLIGG